jgi:uncharacterized protein (TIGR04255 family)
LQKEVYSNAPLRLVTAEFRFPLSPIILRQNILDQFSELLSDEFPIVELTPPRIELNPGSTQENGVYAHPGHRFLTRERTSSVTITPSRVTIETTNYGHWEDFRNNLIKMTISKVGNDLQAIPGLERIGLRYLNEVRVPSNPITFDEWSKFVNSDLVAIKSIAKTGTIETIQSVLHLKMDDSMELVLRSGILNGHLVDDSGPLRLSSPVLDGPFFLIDIDSFWTNSASLNKWNLEDAIDLVDKLHDPIDELFENCITDTLRNEALRREK